MEKNKKENISNYSDINEQNESNLSLKEDDENSYSINSNKKDDKKQVENKNENEKNELKEVGDYIGDRQIKKDPEEMKHLFDICAAYFNYKVKNI